ncbi:MAG: phosphodiester glycosidase family protein [Treponema sp.]|nr:phosphodiester glycosidase family protein [Treponema sp.]
MKRCNPVPLSRKKTPFLRCLYRAAAGFILLAALLFYGPWESFRQLWINTAIYSSRFKFLATALYTGDYIQSVLDKNKPAVDRKTDGGHITVSGSDELYDELYFDRVRGDYFTGAIIKIENPRRLSLVSADDRQGMFLEDLVDRHRALGGINASGHTDDRERGLPWGNTIVDGVFVSRNPQRDRHVMGGLTRDYKLVVGLFSDEEIPAQNYLWALEFGPLLIVNGEKTEMTDFSGGLAPRTAIGQLQNGAMLLVVVDGRRAGSFGATYKDMQTILYANGAVNAIGLDGGSSSTMVYRGELVNTPSEGDAGRRLPNAIIFK